jgi:hypothetical protein
MPHIWSLVGERPANARYRESPIDIEVPRLHQQRLLRVKKLDLEGKKKQAYAIAMADDREMVMAGLWKPGSPR